MTGTHQQWDIVSSVGLTALGVAAARAIETSRDGNLITDQYAAPLTDAANPPRRMPTSLADLDDDEPVWGLMSGYMALRTRFLDDYLTAAGTDQVVILAAGLDARAYRLGWPSGCRVYEVDQPRVLEFKQEVLDGLDARPNCARTPVPADLRDDWVGALQDAGFDPRRPTAWLAEGLLPYLPGRAEEDLFERVHKLSAPGSRIAVEKLGPHGLDEVKDHPMLDLSNERFGIDLRQLWDTEPRRDCAEWLNWAGWDTAMTTVADMERRYQRELGEEVQHLMGDNGMITARRES